jgi:hypothetical protein
LNDYRALDDSHPLIRHVLYLEAIDPSDGDPNNQMTPTPVADKTSTNGISTGWVWAIVIAAVAVVFAIFWWWRHTRSKRGSFDDQNERCCRQAVVSNGGYLAQPSPDTYPQHTEWQDDGSPAMPGHGSGDPWKYPEVPFNRVGTIPYFDPALAAPAVPSSDSSSGDDEYSSSVMDGSFPSSVSGDSAMPTVDELSAAPFVDDEDGWGDFENIIPDPSPVQPGELI